MKRVTRLIKTVQMLRAEDLTCSDQIKQAAKAVSLFSRYFHGQANHKDKSVTKTLHLLFEFSSLIM